MLSPWIRSRRLRSLDQRHRSRAGIIRLSMAETPRMPTIGRLPQSSVRCCNLRGAGEFRAQAMLCGGGVIHHPALAIMGFHPADLISPHFRPPIAVVFRPDSRLRAPARIAAESVMPPPPIRWVAIMMGWNKIRPKNRCWLRIYGGEGWIRTSVGIANGFTARPL
jgi:hypothetical protein